MLTSGQRDLLLQIAIYQQMGDGADFTLFRSPGSAQLRYRNGVSVECVAADEDFERLERAKLIVLSRESSEPLSGRLTEYGKFAAFGMPTGESYGTDWPLKLIPKGTRAYEVLSESMTWAKEHLAFHNAQTLENLPPESASNQEFRDFLAKALAGAFDIEVQALLKDSKLTSDTIEACQQLLDEIGNLYMAHAKKFHGRFIDPIAWPSQVKRRLEARKQYWMGSHIRKVREHYERLNSSSGRTDQLNDKPAPELGHVKQREEQPQDVEPSAPIPTSTSFEDLGRFQSLLTAAGNCLASGGISGTGNEPPPDQGEDDQPSESDLKETSSPSQEAAARRMLIDSFLTSCNKISKVRINRAHIWRLVGHNTARQFEYWQAGDDRRPGKAGGATEQDDVNFRRVLDMKPAAFLAALEKKIC